MRERRLARDALADLIPPVPTGDKQPAASPPPDQRPSGSTGGTMAPSAGGRDRITVQLERDLAEQVRDAVM